MMKKLLITLAISGLALTGYAQQNTIKTAAPGVTYGKTVTQDKAITLAALNQHYNS